MIFKLPRYKKEFDAAPILLRIMVQDADSLCRHRFKKELVITHVLDTGIGYAGSTKVHKDYRATDARNEYRGEFMFDKGEIEILVDYINLKYKRNDGYPSLYHHSYKGDPYHLHIQVAADTKAYMPFVDSLD